MIVRPDDELNRLRRENRELREENDEWRRLAAGSGSKADRAASIMIADIQVRLKVPTTQARILSTLLTTAPAVADRMMIVRALDREDDGPNSRVADVQMVRLRKALKANGWPNIETIKGVGYRLNQIDADQIRDILNPQRAAA